MTRLAIVGAGYVGLVTGACLADRGNSVTLVDLDRERVESINDGRSPFFEPGLDALLARVVPRQLEATTDLEAALTGSAAVVLAVGTPTVEGAIDLQQLTSSIRSVAKLLSVMGQWPIVIVKSTVVPGTTDRLIIPLLEELSGRRAGVHFGVAVNPEFLTEGSAVNDFLHPDRIVIGASDDRTAAAVAELYASFQAPILVSTPATAEMIKYASNTLLSTLISFSNEIANLARGVGDIDVVDVMRGVHSSRYLTTETAAGPVVASISAFLEAGCGYGGSCLPKDTLALAEWGEALGVPMRILRAVDEVNRHQSEEVVAILEEHFPDLAGKKIGILGLAFKPDTDDVRDSPAFPIIHLLIGKGAEVFAHDPRALASARLVLGDVVGLSFEPDLATLVDEVEALILVTKWAEYRKLGELLVGIPDPPLVLDGRRFLEPDEFARYAGIGRRD